MKRAVIDTNIYTDLMNGRPSAQNVLTQFDAILLPVTVIGELLYGFSCGSKEDANRAQLDRFLNCAFARLLEVSRETAESYALLMTSLRKNGMPLPANDIWIAAAACAEKVPLISRDKHFMKINGLHLILIE